jgi:HlyD family secretion protein
LKYLQAQSAYDNALGQAPKTVEEKKLSLDIAEQELENTVMKSPVSGFVKEVSYKDNDLISTNSIICTIVEDNEMYVEASVDEVDLRKIKVGQKVQFVFEPLGNLRLNGVISEVSPIANASGGIVVIPVEFSFNKSPKGTGVIPGLTCSANIMLMENTDVIVIPILAIKKDKNGSYVYVDNGEKTPKTGTTDAENAPGEKRTITIGQITEQYAEIVEGLEEGEIIIIQPDVARATEVMKQLNPSFTGGGKTAGQMKMPTGGSARPATVQKP